MPEGNFRFPMERMSQFNIRDLVTRGRLYVGDNHNEVQGWITDAQWLELAKVEYRELYRKWTRLGLVRPFVVDTSFPAGQYQVVLPLTGGPGDGPQDPVHEGVLAVVGVAEDMVTYMRHLTPAQARYGANPFWVASGEVNMGKASSWAAYGPSDAITVELSPRDPGGNYTVRWIPIPRTPLTLDDQIDLPFGTDERMVLGLARRAQLGEMGSSQLLERLIVEADAEIQFAAHGRLDTQGPRVRRVRSDFHRNRWPWMAANGFPNNPDYWLYP